MATLEALSDDELIYVATLVGLDSSDLSTLETNQLAMYYRNAERALLNRRYPFGYTDDEKSAALEKYQLNIDKAFTDMWNKIGADNESGHSEGGVSRSYLDFDSYFHDVVPVAKVI